MGLFEGWRGATEKVLSPQEAIMVIVVGAIMADDEEITRLRTMCVLSPIFARNTHEQDQAILRRAASVVQDDRDRAMGKAASALAPPLRETAFSFACDMVLADGVLDQREETFMETLARTLGLDAHVARNIIHFTLVRNRGL